MTCLVVGPGGVAICGECVLRCVELFHDDNPEVIERLLDRLLALCETDAAAGPVVGERKR